MIIWADGSQPAMRRPVRGHQIVFQRVDTRSDGLHVSRTVEVYCKRCGTAWSRPVSIGTARKILAGYRGMLAGVVHAATRPGPSCEEAYRILLALEVMES